MKLERIQRQISLLGILQADLDKHLYCNGCLQQVQQLRRSLGRKKA